MRLPIATPCVLFPRPFGKPLTACFDLPNVSSDGGAVLLKAAQHHLGLITAPAECLVDPRQSRKVAHGLEQPIAQRVYGLACGYPEANDAARLAEEQERNGLRDTPTPTEAADTWERTCRLRADSRPPFARASAMSSRRGRMTPRPPPHQLAAPE